MKRFIASIVLSLIIIPTVFSQPPDIIWTRTLDYLGGRVFRDILQTSDGGYLAVGYSEVSYDDDDVIYMKFDDVGNVEWQHTFGEGSHDYAHAAIEHSDGSFIIVGSTMSFSSNERSDGLLIRVDSSGDFDWYRTYGGDNWDSIIDIKPTINEGFILTGYTYDNARDVLLIKLDSDLNDEWIQHVGGDNGQAGYCVEQTHDNGYIISGFYDPAMSTGNTHSMMIKTDSLGSQEWLYHSGGDGVIMRLESVIEAPDHMFIGAGKRTFSDPDIQQYDPDALIVGVSSSGNYIWSETYDGYSSYGSYSHDYFYEIKPFEEGISLVGQTRPNSTSSSGGWIMKMDYAGHEEWQIYNDQLDYSRLAICENGGFTVAGSNQNNPSAPALVHYGIDSFSPDVKMPEKVILLKTYPNPFNAQLNIDINLETSSFTRLSIYNCLGQEVALLNNSYQNAGMHKFSFNANHLPSGVYFIGYDINNTSQGIKRIVLMK